MLAADEPNSPRDGSVGNKDGYPVQLHPHRGAHLGGAKTLPQLLHGPQQLRSRQRFVANLRPTCLGELIEDNTQCMYIYIYNNEQFIYNLNYITIINHQLCIIIIHGARIWFRLNLTLLRGLDFFLKHVGADRFSGPVQDE